MVSQFETNEIVKAVFFGVLFSIKILIFLLF